MQRGFNWRKRPFGFNRPSRHAPTPTPSGPGPELWVQPDFNASTGLTLNSWTVSGGNAHSNSSNSIMSATALDTLVAGTYRVVINSPALIDGSGSFTIFIGGLGAGHDFNIDYTDGNATQTNDYVVASVSDQLIRLRENFNFDDILVSSLSVKRIS